MRVVRRSHSQFALQLCTCTCRSPADVKLQAQFQSPRSKRLEGQRLVRNRHRGAFKHFAENSAHESQIRSPAASTSFQASTQHCSSTRRQTKVSVRAGAGPRVRTESTVEACGSDHLLDNHLLHLHPKDTVKMPSQKTFRTKVKLAKAQKQNRYVSLHYGGQDVQQ